MSLKTWTPQILAVMDFHYFFSSIGKVVQTDIHNTDVPSLISSLSVTGIALKKFVVEGRIKSSLFSRQWTVFSVFWSWGNVRIWQDLLLKSHEKYSSLSAEINLLWGKKCYLYSAVISIQNDIWKKKCIKQKFGEKPRKKENKTRNLYNSVCQL